MLHLNKEGINVTLPVKCSNTEHSVPLKRSSIIEQEADDDVNYTGLLLTYLPGNILSSIQRRTPKLLYDIGTFVGRLNSVFQVSGYALDN